MNIILIQPQDCDPSLKTAVLRGRRLDHISNILKAKVGDVLQIGLINGPLGSGRIRELTGRQAEMDLTLDQPPPEPLPVTLVLALPRPPVFRRVLAHSTALGIKKIVVMQTKRVDKAYWQSPAVTDEDMRTQMMLGLEQSRDTIMPEIITVKRFKPFVEDRLRPDIARGGPMLAAHPDGAACWPEVTSGGQPLTLIIGPEGGFVPFEVDLLKENGALPVSLGPRILRVETVIPFMLGKLSGV